METEDHLPGLWHAASFRVRYQESDQMGVVYHSNYLNWFEIGRTEMLRGLGLSYSALEGLGVLLPVLSADLQYKRSAKYDDIVAVYTRMTAFTPLRIAYEYEVRRVQGGNSEPGDGLRIQGVQEDAAGELLVTGSTGHAWVNREFRPIRLDRTLPEVYEGILGALRAERGAAR